MHGPAGQGTEYPMFISVLEWNEVSRTHFQKASILHSTQPARTCWPIIKHHRTLPIRPFVSEPWAPMVFAGTPHHVDAGFTCMRCTWSIQLHSKVTFCWRENSRRRRVVGGGLTRQTILYLLPAPPLSQRPLFPVCERQPPLRTARPNNLETRL